MLRNIIVQKEQRCQALLAIEWYQRFILHITINKVKLYLSVFHQSLV